MIIVKFTGGLGNQMFQYATYLALEHYYPDTQVAADVSWFNLSSVHNGFELEKVFNIKLNIFLGNPKKTTLPSKYWYKFAGKITTKVFKASLLKKFEYISDVNVFDEMLFQLSRSKNYYLRGNWGSEKYFQKITDLVKQAFVFNSLSGSNAVIADELMKVNSVSVHIRRGDYITDGSFINLCDTSYYHDSFRFITEKNNNPKFFIFSDDIPWCKGNLLWLKDYDYSFIEHNTTNHSYRDLQLMTLCKNNIIANSTFSWWGAWLNGDSDKIVICPGRLFHDIQKNNHIVSEFYPEKWILI